MLTATFSDLENKKILITGATRGIGRAIALSLAKQKAHVLFNFREASEAKAQELVKEIESLGAKATPLLFDLTNEEQMKEATSSFMKENGPIEGLVNNAGISKDQLVLRLKSKDLDDILNTNLKGAMLLSSILGRHFLKVENASIVNMSSIVGLMGNASQCSYAASKAGLIGFTKSYAKEMSPKNIRCNAVCPGFIDTDMTQALDDKVKTTYLSSIPLGRFGSVNEVASLVSFLLSRTSGYITGEVIKVDGGMYI